MFGRFTHALIECVDLEEADRFYEQVLGLEQKARGEHWISLDGGAAELILWRGEKSEVVVGFTGVDLDAARAEIAKRGGDPGEIEDNPGGKHFYVSDPESNTVMIGD